jgi:hypothetical protein
MLASTLSLLLSRRKRGFTGSVPTELVDIIIDHLSEDKHSLSNCGLVCHSWVARSQLNLFHEVSVTRQNAAGFVALLNTPSSKTFTSYIVRLSLVDLGRERSQSADQNTLILSFPTLPNVNTLSLFNTNFETFTQALNLICSFPELHDLSLDEVTWFHRYDRIPQVPSHLPSSVPTLQSLTLNRCPKVDLLNWLLCQDETHAHIHTLHMDGISALETVAIAKFLPRLARSLQHLHFGYTQHADESLRQDVSLSTLTNLYTLVFGAPATRQSWPAVALTQLNSPHLHSIAFTLGGSFMVLKMTDWTVIRQVMMKQHIKRISMAVSAWDMDRQEAESFVGNQVQGYDNKILLDFQL